jgi:ABC-2 type transport system permease protein
LFFLPGYMTSFFQYLSADFHFSNITKGIIDSRDILYFISISFIGLYCANLSLGSRN